ncbi:MAG: hypothetical protein IJ496_11145 [Ruminococcus sp.]|nr:hypothetical protein [Ruminococcus sp.]
MRCCQKAAGHFPDTGEVGNGNYCIAGHNSTIYAESFNKMKHDENRTRYIYTVTEHGYRTISAIIALPL